MRNAGLDDLQAGIKVTRRNINNLRYADDTTILAESEVELKSFLMRVKEESGKAGLKLIISTQRDGMGREEGGGFRMGNTCKPVADSF